MGYEGARHPSLWRRTGRKLVAVGLAAGLAVVLFALALAFSNANSARTIAHNSQLLQWSNASSGTAALTRAALNQALVYTIDARAGVATTEARDTAIGEADAAIVALSDWAVGAPDELEGVARKLAALQLAGRDALAALEEGRVRLAGSILAENFEPIYQEAAAALADAQQGFAGEIATAETSAGRIEQITRLLVTLLIPAAAIAVHQLIVRRQYRERRVEMESRLRAQRELNRAKDDFIAGISHELRTPLTSIFGFSEHLLEDGVTDPAEVAELVAMINRESAELSRMVDDLLTAARLDEGALTFAPEPVRLEDVAESVAATLRRTGHDVRVTGTAGAAWADPERVRQVIRNLASNAIHHGGPLIDITIDQPFPGEPISVTVADDGPGVSEDHEAKLFERFVHEGDTSLLTGSVGLGLAIVRSLVEAMGGHVGYVREHGWSKFTVTVPAAPPGAEAAHPPGPISANASSAANPRDESFAPAAAMPGRDADALVIFGDHA